MKNDRRRYSGPPTPTHLSRLSDDISSLLQFCTSCREAFRTNAICKINGPARKGDSQIYRRDLSSSCQFCSQISPRSKFSSQISLLLEKSSVPSSILSRVQYLPSDSVRDMADIILLSTEFTKHSSMFECNPTPISDILQPRKKHHEPIVRVIPREGIDFSLVQQWITTCESQHVFCKCVAAASKTEIEAQRDLVLVDVRNKRIVRRPPNTRYFALSYVWGNVKQLNMTASNFSALEKEKSLDGYWDQIPQVIKDAMEFTYQVYETYLWVDALCIEQDSSNRYLEVDRMNDIYRQALCTLVAIDSKSAKDGLPGVQPNTRDIPIIANLGHLSVGARRPELNGIFAASEYDKRAWTFQERLMSTRCLYFTKEQVYFHCQVELWSEDRYEHYKQYADQFGAYPLLSWPSQLFAGTWTEKVDLYKKLVHQYSQRRLSFESDRLDAFTGITNAYAEKWGWDFLCGIPAQAFAQGLLWVSTETKAKRIKNQSEDYILPSWSWAGWTGGVYYPLKLITCTIPSFQISSEEGSNQLEASNGIHGEYQLSPPLDEKIAKQQSSANEQTNHLMKTISSIAFESEVVSMYDFLYFKTNRYKPSSSEGVPSTYNPDLHRILDNQRRACGLLFHPFVEHFFNDDSLEFVLIGASRSSVKVLNDWFIDDEDGLTNNVYDWAYHENYIVWNVILIQWKEGGYAERIAIGEIHKEAWSLANPKTKRITLR